MYMAYKSKIIEAVSLDTSWALVICIYTCVQFKCEMLMNMRRKLTGISKKKKQI